MNVHVSPGSNPALVLNADYRPLSYYPLSLWSWQDAIKAVFLDRVNIVSEYETVVHSPSFAMRAALGGLAEDLCEAGALPGLHPVQRVPPRPLPVPVLRRPATTSPSTTSMPRSKGGQTTWDNVVTACSPCNLRKGGKSPREARMWPSQLPYQPSVADLHNNGRPFPPNYLHDSWLDYLYWDSELEP